MAASEVGAFDPVDEHGTVKLSSRNGGRRNLSDQVRTGRSTIGAAKDSAGEQIRDHLAAQLAITRGHSVMPEADLPFGSNEVSSTRRCSSLTTSQGRSPLRILRPCLTQALLRAQLRLAALIHVDTNLREFAHR